MGARGAGEGRQLYTPAAVSARLVRVTESSARLIPKQRDLDPRRAKTTWKHSLRTRTRGGAAGHAWAGAPLAATACSRSQEGFFVIFGVTQPAGRASSQCTRAGGTRSTSECSLPWPRSAAISVAAGLAGGGGAGVLAWWCAPHCAGAPRAMPYRPNTLGPGLGRRSPHPFCHAAIPSRHGCPRPATRLDRGAGQTSNHPTSTSTSTPTPTPASTRLCSLVIDRDMVFSQAHGCTRPALTKTLPTHQPPTHACHA
jgi:hypothetical protein